MVVPHPTVARMDDIQAEIDASHRYMQGADLEDYRTNEELPTFLPSTHSNPGSLDRRITLSNRAIARYARTTSQQPVYQSNTSLTAPRTLHPLPSMFCDHAGMIISWCLFHAAHTHIGSQLPTDPYNRISGGMSSFNRDLSSIRPYSLPAHPLQDRSWCTTRPTRAFSIANSLFCSSVDIIFPHSQ